MFRKDGLILPDSLNTDLSLHPLIIVGLTEQWQVGCMWPNDQLRLTLKGKLTTADLTHFKDAVTLAVKQSLDKRLPTAYTVF